MGRKERKLVNKTTLYYYGYRKSRIAEDKKKSRRGKRQEQKILLEDENDGESNSGRENRDCTAKTRLEQEAAEERAERDEVVRQNKATQIQLDTKCMVRQNTVAQIESTKTAGSLQLIYYVSLMYLIDFLFENLPLNKVYNVFSSCLRIDLR